MFVANQPLPSAPGLPSDLLPSARLSALAQTPISGQAQVARSLGLTGMEALVFLAQLHQHPRPMINALLDKLPIQGMAT